MVMERVKNRCYLFTYHIPSGWDLNLQLIQGNKYNYVIDTGLGSHSVAPVLEYLNCDSKPTIIINTHYHWDHIWGNSSFKDCMIISHRLCRELIVDKWDEMIHKNGIYINGEAKLCLPDLVFENEIYFPEDKIRLIYTPGHTIDSISVLDEEEKVLHAGDNVGDTLEELVPSIYSDKNRYISTLQKYKEMDFDTCISGHNVVLRKDVFEKILEMLEVDGN